MALLIIGAQFLPEAALAQEEKPAEDEIQFNIPRQRTDLAIVEYAEQAGGTFVLPYDEAQQTIANPLVGRYTRQEAIKILLD